jgi:hypothetical protein
MLVSKVNSNPEGKALRQSTRMEVIQALGMLALDPGASLPTQREAVRQMLNQMKLARRMQEHAEKDVLRPPV